MAVSKRYAVIMAALALIAAIVSVGYAQPAEKSAGGQSGKTATRVGYPTDWSARQLVLTGKSAPKALSAGKAEPRHVYNLVRRMVAERNERERHRHRRRNAIKVDWSVSLENGFVQPTQFPAKYNFDVTSEDCNNDYVVFAVSVLAGKPAQGTVIGINNLYTEATPKCNGGNPWVAFAYDTVTQTGGQIKTSPAISMDGTKVAFIESTSTGSYFHVLVLPSPIPAPPSHTGSVLAPQTPTSCATPTVAGCMTTVQVSGASNSLASPWIEYNTDTAYVGTDDGKLYKISPVFGGGAPAVITDTNWPVTVVTYNGAGATKVMTSAIVDPDANRIFVGDGNGFLYAIIFTTPAHGVVATQTIGWAGHGPGTGIVDPPFVVNDAANSAVDQVFTFTGCSNIVGLGGAINQLPANFTSSTPITAVDLGSSDGNGNCTTNNMHAGIFDDAFWNNGTATGHIMGCGFVSGGGSPAPAKMYMFGFDANHLVTSTNSVSWRIEATKGLECSPLTEFSDGTTDRLFYGVGGATAGFVKSSSITAGLPASSTCKNNTPTATCVTTPAALGGTSGIIIDNSVANGGANIYFSTLAPKSVSGQNCNVTGGAASPYCAVKLTQGGLK
jgi:hypothetical protein